MTEENVHTKHVDTINVDTINVDTKNSIKHVDAETDGFIYVDDNYMTLLRDLDDIKTILKDTSLLLASQNETISRLESELQSTKDSMYIIRKQLRLEPWGTFDYIKNVGIPVVRMVTTYSPAIMFLASRFL